MHFSLSSKSSIIETVFAAHLRALLSAALILAILDVAVVYRRSVSAASHVGHLLSYFALTWASAAALALVVGAASTSLELVAHVITTRVPSRKKAHLPLVILLLCLGAALVCITITQPWNLVQAWPYWLFPSIACLVAASLIVARGSLSPRVLASVLLSSGTATFLLDAFAYRRLYLPLHNVLFFLSFILLASGTGVFLSRCSSTSTKKTTIALLGVSLVVQGTLLFDSREARALSVFHGVANPKILSFIHLSFDFDGDGHSAIFGGGDCDDRDPTAYPGACEAESQDRNCNGHVGLTHLEPLVRPDETRAKPLPDVYFFMIDTLRADYGAGRRAELAPEIQAFAKSAIDFERAYTPYPSTYRAMLATVQSRPFRYVRPMENGLQRLARFGYDVQLWIGTRRMKVDDAHAAVSLEGDDPFSHNELAAKKNWTRELVDECIQELENDARPPSFRWIHVLDPHLPHLRGGDPGLDAYRKEVRHVSGQFGRLWRALRSTTRGREAIVILLSDHGEEFRDHGGKYHGATLYEENVHVPLIMHFPDMHARLERNPVSLIDIWPTLFDALHLMPDHSWMGLSRLRENEKTPAVFTQIDEVAGIAGQGRPAIHGWVSERWKLIANLSQNVTELYDLQTDPRERYNLSVTETGRTELLLDELARFQDRPQCHDP